MGHKSTPQAPQAIPNAIILFREMYHFPVKLRKGIL